MHHHYARRIPRRKSRALYRHLLSAAVSFIQFSAQNFTNIFLQFGHVHDQMKFECFLASLVRVRGYRSRRRNGERVISDTDRTIDWSDLESDNLRIIAILDPHFFSEATLLA